MAQKLKTDWLTLLQSATANQPDKIPDGWKTVEEIAQECGKSYRRTSDRLRRLAAQGVVQRRCFKVRDLSGRVLDRPFYRKAGATF